MSDDIIDRRVAAWRLTARFYAEKGGKPPSRDEWAELADLLSILSAALDKWDLDLNG